MEIIKSNLTVSITELKGNFNKVLPDSEGVPVPADLYHEILEDQHWNDLIEKRKKESSVKVNLDDL